MPIRTHRQVRALLLVAATILTLLVAAQPAAAARPATNPATRPATNPAATTENPIGQWTTTVSIPGRPDSVVTLRFRAGHLMTITGPLGADGKPSYAGPGLWTHNGSRLNFTVVHPLPAGDGTVLGVIHGTQQGRLTGNVLQTTGESYLYQPDGTVSGPNPVTMTGVRAAAA